MRWGPWDAMPLPALCFLTPLRRGLLPAMAVSGACAAPNLLPAASHSHSLALTHTHTGTRLLTRKYARTQVGGAQESLKPAAAVSLVVYTLGLPLSFLVILLKHRHAIRADQKLRVGNQGNSEATNPNFHIRRRYQELYRCRSHTHSRACVWPKRASAASAALREIVEVRPCVIMTRFWCTPAAVQPVPAGAVLVAPGADPPEVL
jgi:hypothetical protein